MGHTCGVGRLLLGHTVRQEGRGGVDRSLSGQWSLTTSAGLLGQTPPTVSDHVGEMFVGLAGDVTFEASHDLGGVEPFVSPPCHIPTGLLMAAHPGEDDPVEGGVGLTVSSPVEPEPGGHFA